MLRNTGTLFYLFFYQQVLIKYNTYINSLNYIIKYVLVLKSTGTRKYRTLYWPDYWISIVSNKKLSGK